MHKANSGQFICADCGHERDLLSNIARTIDGKTYCGGCAAKKKHLDRLAKERAASRELTQDM